jgi:hypothetical protein
LDQSNTLRYQPSQPAAVADRIELALANADSKPFKSDPVHYRRLANAAHTAAQFDNTRAINTRAMFPHAIAEARPTDK